MKTRVILFVVLTSLFSSLVVVQVLAQDAEYNIIDVEQDNLYPEGLSYAAESDQFFFSSFSSGSVFAMDEAGEVTAFVEDPQLISSVGLYVDEEAGRLLVANSDPGVSINTDESTQGATAGLGVYNLEDGELIYYVDLASLLPDTPHFANGIAVDADGNAYVTDSFAPVIYKVTPDGDAEVFVEAEAFAGEGFVLNGIVYHPDGYLIVAKSDEGLLFNIPTDNPETFAQIETDQDYIGVDDLVWAGDDLVLITNVLAGSESNTVHVLQSEDEWSSASGVSSYELDVTGTSGIVSDNTLYVVGGYLENIFNPDFEGVDSVFNLVELDLNQ